MMSELGYAPLSPLESVCFERPRNSNPIWKWFLISLGFILYTYLLIYTVEHQVLYQENAPINYGKIPNSENHVIIEAQQFNPP